MAKIQENVGKICEILGKKIGKNSAFFNENFEIREDSKAVQRSALCRSRRELSNEYLLAKIGVDTAENEPLEVWGKIQFTIHFTP